MSFHDKKHVSPAAVPQSRNARVYQVNADDMPGKPRLNTTVEAMMSHAKVRHAKVMDYHHDDLTARKIGENEDGIVVVVIEP